VILTIHNIRLVYANAIDCQSTPDESGTRMTTYPNIVMIITDQQRADTMACYGNSVIKTPNLNKLADESFIFDNAYVSQPICTPSRSTILTGLYPHATGCVINNLPLNYDVPTIAEMAPEEYLTAYYGKWHLGNEVKLQRGFDEWLSCEDQYRKYYSDDSLLEDLSDYHHYLVAQGYTPDLEDMGRQTFSRDFAAGLPIEHSRAMFLADKTSEFINTNKDRPFIIYVGILEPHPPYENALSDIHDPDEVTLGEAFMQSPGENASKLNQSRETEVPSDIKTEADWRKLKAKYWGNVSMVDRSVEKIISALESAGISDRTAVMLTSEHGDQMGDHNILEKSVLYEESARVPMLMKVPWIESGNRRIEGRFSLVDLAPTVLDLVGADIPDQIHGRSRLPVLRGDETLIGNDVVVEWNGRNLEPSRHGAEFDRIQNVRKRSIVGSDGWKLVVGLDDKNELFDLNSDPSELHNLIDSEVHRSRAEDMLTRLVKWQSKVDDQMELPSAKDL
jgi:arylsulfatase A-like enzyme